MKRDWGPIRANPAPAQAYLGAAMGLTRIARVAGTMQATRVTTDWTQATAANVAGS